MANDIIRYDLLVQDALRGVVRKVLAESAREGLPGEHHYYITFRTEAPGVRLSTRMRERYPGEMTIVLQHQFWDLSVTEQNFEVGLSFNNIPEKLLIPFDAITGFFDPSVQFALKFEVQEDQLEEGANDTAPPAKPHAVKAPRVARIETAKTDAARSEAKAEPKSEARAEKRGEPTPQPRPVAAEKAAKPAAPEKPQAVPEATPKVVSIDAFRKKT